MPDNAAIDQNRTKSLIGVSKNDFATPTTAAVDPVTHELLTQTSGGGGGTQYTDASTPPTNPIGNALEYVNTNGNDPSPANWFWNTVSDQKPLPVNIAALGAPGVYLISGSGNALGTETDPNTGFPDLKVMVQEMPPTDPLQNNASIALSYDGSGNLQE